MSQCPDLCREWIRETEDGPEPTEVGEDFGGRCFCCHGIVEYQVWRFRCSEQERRFLCYGCYVKSALVFVRPLAKIAVEMGWHYPKVVYELGWTTEPGLRGLSVSEFRAVPIGAADRTKGDGQTIGPDERVVAEFASEAERDEFLRGLEEHFAARRFTNTGDAFDTVKAYVLERAAKRI